MTISGKKAGDQAVVSLTDMIVMLVGGCLHGVRNIPESTNISRALPDFSVEEIEDAIAALVADGTLCVEDADGLFYTTTAEIEARRSLAAIQRMVWGTLFERIGESGYMRINLAKVPRIRAEVLSSVAQILARCAGLPCHPFVALEAERITRRLEYYAACRTNGTSVISRVAAAAG